MAKHLTAKLAAVALAAYAPSANAAVIIQNMHASGYIIAGYVTEGFGEYFTNYSNLAGKKVTLDISTKYTGEEYYDNLVNIKYRIDDINVYTLYGSLPGADPSDGSYYCGCDSNYDHLETSDYVGLSLPMVDNGTFKWSYLIGPINLSLKGPVSGSTSYGPIVPAFVGDITTNAAGNAYFSFVLTDVRATIVDLSAVPEPSSWAMMIGGFAVIGGVARRRRARLALSCA